MFAVKWSVLRTQGICAARRRRRVSVARQSHLLASMWAAPPWPDSWPTARRCWYCCRCMVMRLRAADDPLVVARLSPRLAAGAILGCAGPGHLSTAVLQFGPLGGGTAGSRAVGDCHVGFVNGAASDPWSLGLRHRTSAHWLRWGSAAVGAPRALVGCSQLRLGDVVKPGRVGIVDGTYWLTTSGATPAWHRRAVPASRAAAAGEVPVRARRRHRPSDQRAPAAPAAADPAWSCANCRRQRCWSKT